MTRRSFWLILVALGAEFCPIGELVSECRRHPSCWILNYNYFSTMPTPNDLARLQM